MRAVTPPSPMTMRGEGVSRLKHLQTGIGTAHTTAISATVIFSLVDKSMASLRTRCQHHLPYTRPLVL